MEKRDDRRSAPRRGASGATIDPTAVMDDAGCTRLDHELRDLYREFGGDGDIPDRLLDLARKISDAYEDATGIPASDAPGNRRGDS